MLGMDTADAKILRLLGDAPVHPSEISRRLGLVRTTVQYRLARLARAGLAEKAIVGRKSVWRATYPNGHNKNHYRAYVGDEILQAYAQLLTLPRGTVVLSVQGEGAAKGEFASLPKAFIREAHAAFKRRGIVMLGVSNEKVLALFDTLDSDMIRSHIGRPQGLKIFSDGKFLASGEIMSTEHLLILANPTSRLAIVIKDKGIAKIVNDLLAAFFDLLDADKSFDLNRYLKARE